MNHLLNPDAEAGAPDDSQGSNIADLNELAAAAEAESGDAKKAWRLLAAGIDATELPYWVKAYVKKSAKTVAAYDIKTGDQAHLAHMLGFYKEPETYGAGYDPDELLDWFSDRMQRDLAEGKKLNISRTAYEYWEEVMKRNSKSQPGGIRKAYAKARDDFISGIKQDIEFGKRLADWYDSSGW